MVDVGRVRARWDACGVVLRDLPLALAVLVVAYLPAVQSQGTRLGDVADRPSDALAVVAVALRERFVPYIDRPLAELSPIEHAVLLIGSFELVQHVEVPYRVAINEAVELAKSFGGTDGYRFVNGVLDKLAAEVRAPEVQATARR